MVLFLEFTVERRCDAGEIRSEASEYVAEPWERAQLGIFAWLL